MPTPVRILILDDHQIVREGISALINSEPLLKVTALTGNVAEATRFMESHQVDCAIIDFSLPDQSGLDFIDWLRVHHPICATILLTMHSDPGIHQQALELGAIGCILKESASSDLIRLIRKHFALSNNPKPILSEREQEVLISIQNGLTAKETAEHLGIKPKTVETYRERLMQKFGARNSNQLIQSAISYSACNPLQK